MSGDLITAGSISGGLTNERLIPQESSCSISGGSTHARIIVVGDGGTGKTSLISAFATKSFSEQVPTVLSPVNQLQVTDTDRVTIIDTSSSLERRDKVFEELKLADAAILTFSWDQPSSFDRLTTFWLPEFRRLQIKVPVIVVGCKLDKRWKEMKLEKLVAPLIHQFSEIEKWTECSAAKLAHVREVFYYAYQAALFPTVPLFDHELQELKPFCKNALNRIFMLCDHDMDGALNDDELNQYQIRSINRPTQPATIASFKKKLQEMVPESVDDKGLTLSGFLFFHKHFIKKGRIETTWTALRNFGYNNEIRLRDLSIPFKKAPDQSVELTDEAMVFLKGVFSKFDAEKDGVLDNYQEHLLFSTAPESPWRKPPYSDIRLPWLMLRRMSLSNFLSKWVLMTLLEPAESLTNLIYIGYNSGAASAFRLTRRRSVDRIKQQSDRNVYQCFVFGPTGSGKTRLLQSFLGGWPFFPDHYPTTGEHYVANVVDRPGGTKKTLVLREIIEDKVEMLLSNKKSLASCDVAVFLYDKSDENSLKRASELLTTVARLGETSGFMVPSLLVAAKDDLLPYPTSIEDSAEICQNVGIDAPIHISVKQENLNNVYNIIVTAAEHPHLSLPETELARSQKRYRRLVNRSLMLTSVVGAVAVAGLAAYQSYVAWKNTSS